ncbi:hypothetical protein [Corynebacterium pelargi]|uniref:hypothetical protein n=1 Tax=Corynebacterium pelargi TaxID=1471400 RepID=UPI0013E8E6CF|nr:hypothetical protein [Corynebacterium pelargi]
MPKSVAHCEAAVDGSGHGCDALRWGMAVALDPSQIRAPSDASLPLGGLRA